MLSVGKVVVFLSGLLQYLAKNTNSYGNSAVGAHVRRNLCSLIYQGIWLDQEQSQNGFFFSSKRHIFRHVRTTISELPSNKVPSTKERRRALTSWWLIYLFQSICQLHFLKFSFRQNMEGGYPDLIRRKLPAVRRTQPITIGSLVSTCYNGYMVNNNKVKDPDLALHFPNPDPPPCFIVLIKHYGTIFPN